MNLIIRMLIVWIVLDFEIKLIFGAYKKRKDEHCSLQVNSMCYDDELQNDKPLKIVHDETGMKIVADEEVTKKKRPKKVSTDVLQPKVSRQLSWDLPKLFSKLNLLNSHNAQQTAQQQSTTIHSPPLTRSQLDSSKLIVKFHKLNNSRTNRPLTKFKQSNVPATVIPNTVVYNQLTSLRSPIVNSNIATNHLNKFKAINRPLLASGSFHNAAYLTKGFNKFNSYPLISPFVNTLTLSLPDHYSDSLLLTEESPNYTAYDFRRPTRRPTKIASNYLPKSISNKKIPKNLSFDSLRTTTTVAPTASTNYWMPSYFTTSDALITEPLPTNLTNYINLRESGKLGSYLANQTSESHNNYNTTQDRVWTEDEPNDIFPTKSSASSKFDFSFDSRKSINKTDDKMFDKLQFESSNSLETDLTTPNSDHPFSSTEESSKEEIDAFKLSNQLANHPNEFERAKDHNQDRFFRFTKPDGFIKPEQNVKQDDSREFGLNEKFESAQPLNQHEWPTVDHHHLDELLATGGKEKTNHEKSQINYLVDGDDEQKENLLMNQNYPIFYPAKAATNGNRKPTYTIVQSKDKNVDKWKRYIKLMKRIAVEEAKKFKKNELDTFLKRKKLIVDRYKPNDMYQKAIAARYVWKKVSLDFLSLLGYQIANYLGPLHSKHWIQHSNVLDEKPNDDQLKAIEHIIKNQNVYYQSPLNSQMTKYLMNNQLGDQAFSDYAFNTHSTADQFLNDDSFFNQNYFKLKENDDSYVNQNYFKLKENDDSYVNQNAHNHNLLTEEPMMASSLTSDRSVNRKGVTNGDAFQPAHLSKEKRLDKQFFENQLLNNKLLNDQLLKEKLIDFKTKEQLQQVIKPIKIIQNE